MALIFYSPINPADVWEAELKKHVPDLDFRRWEAPGDKAEIDMALVWKPPPGGLAAFPNLKVIFSLAAGIDHLLADPGPHAEVRSELQRRGAALRRARHLARWAGELST